MKKKGTKQIKINREQIFYKFYFVIEVMHVKPRIKPSTQVRHKMKDNELITHSF